MKNKKYMIQKGRQKCNNCESFVYVVHTKKKKDFLSQNEKKTNPKKVQLPPRLHNMNKKNPKNLKQQKTVLLSFCGKKTNKKNLVNNNHPPTC